MLSRSQANSRRHTNQAVSSNPPVRIWLESDENIESFLSYFGLPSSKVWKKIMSMAAQNAAKHE